MNLRKRHERERMEASLTSQAHLSIENARFIRSNIKAQFTDFEANAAYVTYTLLRVIAWTPLDNEGNMVRIALCCDLLCKGFHLFKHHIMEFMPLIRRLYQLSSMKQYVTLATAAQRALLESGRVSSASFINCMGKDALSHKNNATDRQTALMSIVALVRRHPAALAKVIPTTVQTIIKCLDPSEPTLRKSLLNSTTAALYTLVQKYPVVSFHQESQRFAVGTSKSDKNVIIIYDLKTATKWRILEGHKEEVTAVAFNQKGNMLVSYSALESPKCSIRIWNTGIPTDIMLYYYFDVSMHTYMCIDGCYVFCVSFASYGMLVACYRLVQVYLVFSLVY